MQRVAYRIYRVVEFRNGREFIPNFYRWKCWNKCFFTTKNKKLVKIINLRLHLSDAFEAVLFVKFINININLNKQLQIENT